MSNEQTTALATFDADMLAMCGYGQFMEAHDAPPPINALILVNSDKQIADLNLEQDAKGKWYDEAQGRLLNSDELTGTLLKVQTLRSWMPKYDPKQRQKPFCRSSDGVKPIQEFQAARSQEQKCAEGSAVCKGCQHAQWGADNAKPNCLDSYRGIWMMPDNSPRVIYCHNTAAPVLKKYFESFMVRGVPTFGWKTTLGSVFVKGDYAYHTPTFQTGEKNTQDDVMVFVDWMKKVLGAYEKAAIERDESAASESAPAAPAGSGPIIPTEAKVDWNAGSII